MIRKLAIYLGALILVSQILKDLNAEELPDVISNSLRLSRKIWETI